MSTKNLKIAGIITFICFSIVVASYASNILVRRGSLSAGSATILCEEVTSNLDTNWGSATSVRGNTCTTNGSGGTLTEICVWMQEVDADATVGIKLVVAETSGGDPSSQSVVGQVNGTLTASTTGEYCFEVSGSPSLSASTTYYVGGFSEDGGDDGYGYSNSQSGWTAYAGNETYSTAFGANLSAGYSDTADRRWSFWAKYE